MSCDVHDEVNEVDSTESTHCARVGASCQLSICGVGLYIDPASNGYANGRELVATRGYRVDFRDMPNTVYPASGQ